MPCQTGRSDAVDVGIDAKIGFAIHVEMIQGDEDRGFLKEFDGIKRDFLAVFMLRLVPGTNLHRIDRCAKDVFAILWIGNPASLCAVEDSVCPSLDIERESVHVDIGSSSNGAPVVVPVELDSIEEDDDLGRSDEWALKVDADRCRGFGILPEVAHVFTSEKIQITGCEGEHVFDPSVKLGTFPGNEAAIGPILCEDRNHRLDEERVVFVHI